jgi:hypothetical protein
MKTLDRFRNLTLALATAFCCSLTMADAAEAAEDRTGQWHISAYSGQAAVDRLLDIITRFNTPFIDSYLVAVAPGWVHRQTKNWRFEIEGQVVNHWGLQDHWEFNGAYIARWMPFFWDEYVDTSFAVGAGASYATEVPVIEPRARRFTEENSAKLLGYLMMEFEFSPPNDSPIAAFVRLHHRSGGKGLFKDVDGGSNFITGGLRWDF